MAAPILTQSGIQIALRNFLLAVLPSGVEVIEGQDNRVSEPADVDFVIMTTIFRDRLGTNIETYADVSFTGSISGTTLTITHVNFGTIVLPAPLFGINVAAGTQITAPIAVNPDGTGTYTISQSQNVGSESLAGGQIILTQPTAVHVQLDFHSDDVTTAADMAQTVTTVFRSGYAVDLFNSYGYAVTPLYCDDPRQRPFYNAEQQVETRWSVDAVLQASQSVYLPQDFAGSLSIQSLTMLP